MSSYTYKLLITPHDPSKAQELLAKMYLYPMDAVEDLGTSMAFFYSTEEAYKLALQAAHKESDLWKIETEEIKEQNWNALWEADYPKVRVGNRCEVIAPFHTPETSDYTIVIEPQTSFGTGHHATTYLMLEALIDLDLSHSTVLDMGAGTGVLAILAALKNAAHIDAVEIHSMAVDNIYHNIALNKVDLNVHQGGIEVVPPLKYDLILANINKNALMSMANDLKKHSLKGAKIFLSGFYSRDIEEIIQHFENAGFSNNYHKIKQDWALVVLDL